MFKRLNYMPLLAICATVSAQAADVLSIPLSLEVTDGLSVASSSGSMALKTTGVGLSSSYPENINDIYVASNTADSINLTLTDISLTADADNTDIPLSVGVAVYSHDGSTLSSGQTLSKGGVLSTTVADTGTIVNADTVTPDASSNSLKYRLNVATSKTDAFAVGTYTGSMQLTFEKSL